ncbi:fibronectin type III domain-containing protein [Actinosynnema sp. NPDC050801]|uniref:fibronectin type III domain-containing protein n=1 Tax=unclassified Actinosynnema TaxID=2637065 RepID=UPI003400D09F
MWALVLLAGSLAVPPDVANARADTPAGTLTALWNSYGDQGGHWTGGDSTVSVRLPDGRVAWLFSDTFLGTVAADHSRPRSTPFIRNSLVVQQGTRLAQTVHGGTPASPTSLVSAADPQDFYWVGSATVQGGELKVLYGKYRAQGEGPLGFQRIGTALVTIALPGLTVTSVTDLPLDARVGWGTAVFTDGGYDYVYGTEDVDGFKYAHVARAVAGNLGAAWEFWTGTRWSASDTESARVFSGGGTAFSVTRVGGRVVVVTHDGNVGFSPWFVAYTAGTPTGPFAGPTYLHKAPEAANSAGWQFGYDPQLHQEQAAPGTLLMSYNNNSLNSDDNYRDARIYRPRFVDITWPQPVPDPAAVPAPPTGLAVSAGDDGAGKLTWTAPPGTGLTYFVHQRDVTAGQTHFARFPDSTTATAQNLSGLRDGHTYEYRVSANNAAGEGQFSTTVTLTARVVPPYSPTNLRAVPGTTGDIALSWNAVTGNVQYTIERRDVTAGEGEFAEVWFPHPSSTSHTVPDLTGGHVYEFRVSARNGGGTSAPSAAVQATAVVAPPQAPTGLTATAQGDGSVKLAWTAPGEGLWYWVHQRDVTAGEPAFTQLAYPSTEASAQPGMLINGHVYEFRVTAVNGANLESPPSATRSATARYDAPAEPTGLTAQAQGDGSVKLAWTAPGEGHWYWVYQRDVTANEATFTKGLYPATENRAQPGLLINGHTYEFKVTAVNPGGVEGPAGATVTATARYVLPAAPTNLTAIPEDGEVTLSWSGPAPDLWYWIYQRDTSSGDSNFTRLEYPITDGTSSTVGLLENGHTYEFKVSAINAGGEGPASPVVTGKPLPLPPAQVGGLVATPEPTGEITLTWNALPSVYYWVYYRDVTAGGQFQKSSFPAGEPRSTVGFLTHDHVYDFKVAATNLAGDGPDSAVVRATARVAPPSAPANLRGSAAGDGGVDLAWDPTGAGVYYWLYRKDITAGETTYTKSGSFTDKSYASWEGLRDGHVYDFQVRADNIAGLGPASNTVRVTARGGLPAAPTNLIATAGNGRVGLTWTASTTANVLYSVYYRDVSAGEQFRKLDVPFGNPRADMTPLTNGHVYEFKVAATHASGDSRATPVVSARPLPPVPAAAHLTAIAGNHEVGLGWSAVTHATYFWVEYRDLTAGQTGWRRLGAPVHDWAFTVRSLANGHRYEFRVISGNVAGESGPSNPVQATPVPPVPAAPSNLRATAGNTTASLAWSGSASASYYWVYFRPQGHSGWYVFDKPANGTSSTATGLLNGFTYEFRVTAANLGGQSGPSNTVAAKPFLPPPATPTNLRVTAGDQKAQLAWNGNNSSGAAYYWVYFQPQGHTQWYYYRQPVYGTSFTATGLLNGYDYSFRVTAANAAGQTGPTNTVTVKPLPPIPVAPGWITATADADSAWIRLSWGASPTPGTVYEVEYRNRTDEWGWYTRTTTRSTGYDFYHPAGGSVWEFRIRVANMAGSSYSPTDSEVGNVWTGNFRHSGRNTFNGANAAALSLIASLNPSCSTAMRQVVCFGVTLNGRPITIGDYFFFPYSRADLNRVVSCEAYQRLDLRRQYGRTIERDRGLDLLKHEAVHTWQASNYWIYSQFTYDYALEAAKSHAATGTDYLFNNFEIEANLWAGHYKPSYGNTRSCPHR